MNRDLLKKLKEAGRYDLIESHKITMRGLAGVLSNGNIVDRVEHPEAISVLQNPMMGIPKPAVINLKAVKALKDNDGHWYLIPNIDSYEFNDLVSETSAYEGTPRGDDANDAINEKFSKYMLDGDLNETQMYINVSD